ncbi:MAG: HD domain-containing phosphohydrolase [Lachnospiraceae bacterium]|nr:HD domain-containing phosphohydrolase [Lachnospiraceae bacterium]
MELGIEQIQNSKTVMEELNTSIMHGIYVSNMAYLLSKEIGLSEEQCYELAVAGMLHDIGKIRASKLMYVEQPDHNFVIKQINYLRRHPFLGYDLLKNKGYSDFILESILFHHENYDGSGYPSNLSGEMIPIGARVLRICDVFVALISKRAYRPAHDVDSALEFMIGDVKYFDMKIFLKFMNLIHEIDVNKDIKKNTDIE